MADIQTMRAEDNMREGLVSLVKDCASVSGGNLNVVELGSYAGESARIMLDTGLVRHITCIDPWKAGFDTTDPASFDDMAAVEAAFDAAVAGDPRVSKFKGTCSEYVRTSYATGGPGSVDLVYIDACHTYNALLNDITRAALYLRPSVAIAGHDICLRGIGDAVFMVFGHAPDKTYGDGSWLYFVGSTSSVSACDMPTHVVIPRVINLIWLGDKRPFVDNVVAAYREANPGFTISPVVIRDLGNSCRSDFDFCLGEFIRVYNGDEHDTSDVVTVRLRRVLSQAISYVDADRSQRITMPSDIPRRYYSAITDGYRWMLLHNRGGIFLDFDTFPVQPFSDELLSHDELMATGDVYFLGCSPNKPFRFIEYCTDQLSERPAGHRIKTVDFCGTDNADLRRRFFDGTLKYGDLPKYREDCYFYHFGDRSWQHD